jgi:hypothetical protein
VLELLPPPLQVMDMTGSDEQLQSWRLSLVQLGDTTPDRRWQRENGVAVREA